MSINDDENRPLLNTSSVLFGTVATGEPYSRARAGLFESISTEMGNEERSSALPPMPGASNLYRSVDLHASVTGREWLVPSRRRLDSNMVRFVDADNDGETLDLGVHEMPWAELSNFLRVEIDHEYPGQCSGLTEFAAQERLGIDGPNVLTPPAQTPEWLKYIHCYLNFFMGLLFVAGVISFALYAVEPSESVNLWLGVILFAIIILTATMEYFQNRAASNIMDQIAGLVSTDVVVRRDGSERNMDPKNLVIGDVCRLGAGDRVPADVRLLWSNGMKVDNASLTGEAEPQLRKIESTSNEMLETANVAFSGTLVTTGEGVGIVIATGDACMIGQIASLAGADNGIKTPLEIEIEKFVRLIGVISASLAVILVILGIVVAHESIGKAGYNAVGILVANVPQGLPATVAISLFLAAKRLRASQVVVKTLQQVETLGSVSVICSDKTGTLTQNRMTASNAWLPGSTELVSLRSQDSNNVPPPALDMFAGAGKLLLNGTVLCSRARFAGSASGGTNDTSTPEAIEALDTLGDATESGYLRLVAKVTDYQALRDAAPKLFEIPFNSVNKFQLSIHDGLAAHRDDGVDRVLIIKGAPEVILGKSTVYVDSSNNSALGEIDEAFNTAFQTQYDALGRLGERVLAFAELPLGPDTGMADVGADYFDLESGTVPLEGLHFLGLVSLIDPPKFSVPDAVALCTQAGIKTIMMTGDHVTTAEAIGRQIGIITGKTIEDVARERGCDPSEVQDHEYDAVVVHGSRIESLTQDDWDAILSKNQIVFGRLSPMHKVDIVRNNQRLGAIVAVTGDGVNDAPSLKISDVGVAMQISGSEVSKDAADIILLDDNFASLVLGVRVGRVILDNLRKSSTYIVTHLSAELVPVLINILFGIPLGLQSLQMLLIDLGTEIIPGVALSFETAESDVMQRPPRNVKTDRMMGKKSLAFAYAQAGTLQSLGCIFAFFFVLWDYGGYKPSDLWEARGDIPDDVLYMGQSAWFTAILVQQCVNLISMRTRSTSVFNHPPLSNVVIFYGWIYSIILGALMIYIPGLNEALYFRAFPANKTWYWALGLPGGLAIFIYAEFCKLANRKKWGIGRFIGF